MFNKTIDNKRYHTINYHYKELYGKKVIKISLDAHFSCPNKVNDKGCIFCNGDFSSHHKTNIIDQFNENKEVMDHKWPNSLYIAYLQNNTNTYADITSLKNIYEPLLLMPNIIGLTIATRPDSISDECLEYLSELNKKTKLTIELGLQSIHDKTLKLINRGHDLNTFLDCYKRLKEQSIEVVVHIINGLPGETKEDMINTVKLLNDLKIDGIKIHMLYVTTNTKLAEMYQNNEFNLLTKEEYIAIVCEQLTYLNPDIVIHRITGDPLEESLIDPSWLMNKCQLLNDIDKYMKAHNLYQGLNTYNK